MSKIDNKTTTIEELKNYMMSFDAIARACGEIDREMHITPINQGGVIRGYVFSIDGTPPKGYATHNNCAEMKQISIYDMFGKRLVTAYGITIKNI